MGRKYPKLILDGHDFNKEKTKQYRTLWACSSYSRTKCPARLKTIGNIVYINFNHNHEPKNPVLNQMKSKIVMIVRRQGK